MGALAAALGTAAALAVAGGAGALAAAAIALTAPGLRRAGEGAPALPDTTPDC